MNMPSWSDITYQENGSEKVDFKKLKAALKTCASEFQSQDLCTPAVEHFNLFHGATPNDKYVSFFFNGKNQKFQLNYTKKTITPALLSTLVAFSQTYKINLYMSEFCYLTGLNRRESNVFSTNVITMDLDKKDLDIDIELSKIQKICDKNGLKLSAVFSSGRGHYLVFKLTESYICAKNSINLKRWKHNYDLICDIFQDYGADYKCKDISRVFRLMGSYNYKDDTEYETEILQTWDVDNEYLKIPCCKETADKKMFTDKTTAASENKIVPKRKKAVTINPNTEYVALKENRCFKTQNKKRIKDLLKLLSLRYDHLGDRHIYLYVMINQLNVSGYSYNDALKFLLEKVNPKFSLAESEYEIVRQLQSIYQKNTTKKEVIDGKTVEYVDNHYHSSTTQWIIDTLQITECEQEQLSVLKNKDMLAQLRQEKRLTKFRCQTQNKKENKKKQFNQLAEDHSIQMIAEKTNFSNASVYRKLEKTPKQIKIEKENAIILQLKEKGFTNSKIAKEIGLSFETVKKRLQKINKEQNLNQIVETNEKIIDDNVEVEVIQTLNSFSDLVQVESDVNNITNLSDTGPPDDSNNTLAELPW